MGPARASFPARVARPAERAIRHAEQVMQAGGSWLLAQRSFESTGGGFGPAFREGELALQREHRGVFGGVGARRRQPPFRLTGAPARELEPGQAQEGRIVADGAAERLGEARERVVETAGILLEHAEQVRPAEVLRREHRRVAVAGLSGRQHLVGVIVPARLGKRRGAVEARGREVQPPTHLAELARDRVVEPVEGHVGHRHDGGAQQEDGGGEAHGRGAGARGPAGALANDVVPAESRWRERLHVAAGPPHREASDLRSSAQAEQDARVPGGSVAAVGVRVPQQVGGAAAAQHRARAERVAPAVAGHQAQPEPGGVLAHPVQEQPSGTVFVDDHDVHVAVAVQVTGGEPASHLAPGERLARAVRHVGEAAVPEVAQEQPGLRQRQRIHRSRRRIDEVDRPVGQGQIEPAVVVVVEKARAESRERQGGRKQAGGGGAVLEHRPRAG